ncbi:DUF1302 domain-containing protein [Aromatoleum toluclasticum]|nr:DUF1302 domain-containing protein [Aromatoleum toluclasticum]
MHSHTEGDSNMKAIEQPRLRGALIAAAIAAALPATRALAFEMDTGNSDLNVRWDNSIRYNAGWRVADRKSALANNNANDQAEFLFDKGDMVNNRVDLLTELDVAWKQKSGLRLSAAAWADGAYGASGESHPRLAGRETYTKNRFSGYTKRFYRGPDGEVLDAFLWGNLELGGTELALKAGRHASLWGEAVFPTASANSVAFAQAPSDGLKSATSPGANAKETVLPLNQVTATWQVDPNLSFSGLYTLEWRSSRLPEGGTFFGISDGLLLGPDFIAPGIPWGDPREGRQGDVGVNMRWRPAFLDEASIGLYYRRFDDKGPSFIQMFRPGSGPLEARAVYARDISVVGASIATIIGGHSVSAEVSHRNNTPLLAAANFPVLRPGQDLDGVRGDTWHFLANSTSLFNKTPLWDTASLVVELTYQRLDEVTKNKAFYKSKDHAVACASEEIVKGCATKDAWHLALAFTPTWQQALPSIDLSMPVVFQTGLKGNAPTGGITEGGSVFRIALAADFQLKHKFELAYTNYWGKDKFLGASSPAGRFNQTNGAMATYEDRDVVTLTYAYSF